MSGGKGTQQTGSATGSTESRAGSAQFPYYEGGLKEAGRIYGDSEAFPNYAPPSPWQTQGYPDLFAATRPNPIQTGGLYDVRDTASNVQGWPTAKSYDAYGNLISGGGTSPAASGYGAFAAGQGGPQQTADRVVGNAVNAAYGYANPITGYANQAAAGNLGQDQLAAVAQGKYTDASSNPYLRQMADAALGAAERSYQRGTSPETAARFSGGGRYGSGANDAAIRANEESFLRGQGDISNKFFGDEYRFERGQQDTAAQQYDAARRAGLGLGMTGLAAAGNMVDQGERTALSAADLTQRGQTTGLAGLDTGFGRSLTAQQNALQNFPQFIQSLFAPGLATAQAGAGLSAQELAAARGEIEAGTGQQTLQQQAYNAPFERLRQYMATIGAPSGGLSETKPIFGNPLTSALSGATGLLGLGKELGLGGSGGLGGLGSAGGFLGSQGPLFGSLADASIAAGGPPLAAELTAAGAAGLEGLPIAASAGFWIVCTELMRQGRMPKRHYLAGWPVFAAYPERGKRGYYLWAIPLVRHLRRKPDSLLSRAAGAVFRWRAENIAAHAGVPGARKLWRGAAVTAVLYPVCAALGAITPPQDWEAVYREEQAACSP